MIRPLTTALLVAGLTTLGLAADEIQPDPQYKTGPSAVYVYPAGRSYLGVDIRDVSADRVSTLKLKEERGVEITMVDQDAPAGKAGLKEHDVILEFNGAAVDSEEQLRRMIREVPPGRTVALGISRDGSPMKISVQLAAHDKVAMGRIPPIPPIHVQPPQMDIPGTIFQVQTYSSYLGIQTENLTRQLGDFFGVKDGEGILVRSVEKGSAGEKAGLKAGDVIVRADNEKLSGRSDLAHILRSHHEGGKITLGVVRDKHEQAFVVTLPDRGSRDSSYLDLDSLGFDSEGLRASLGKLDGLGKALEGLKGLDSLDLDIDMSALDLGSFDLEDAGQNILELTPEIEKSLHQAEQEIRRGHKLLENQQHEFKFNFDPFI